MSQLSCLLQCECILLMCTCGENVITGDGNLFCRDIASDRRELAKLGITHILNCAQSKWRGGAEYYAGMNITYHGIEAHDSPTFDMSVNFYPAAEFIHKALMGGGWSASSWDWWENVVLIQRPRS